MSTKTQSITLFKVTENTDGLVAAFREIFRAAREDNINTCFIEYPIDQQAALDSMLADTADEIAEKGFGSPQRMINMADHLHNSFDTPYERRSIALDALCVLAAASQIKLIACDADCGEAFIYEYILHCARPGATPQAKTNLARQVLERSDPEQIAEKLGMGLEFTRLIMQKMQRELDDSDVISVTQKAWQHRTARDPAAAAHIVANMPADGRAIGIYAAGSIDPMRQNSIVGTLVQNCFDVSMADIVEGGTFANHLRLAWRPIGRHLTPVPTRTP